MTMDLQFDHAVILVNDLEQASADYRSMGFNVYYGGQHADGKTHNALIVFQDGTYLELLAPTNPALLQSIDISDQKGFISMFAKGEGFGGYALLSKHLAADVKVMQGRGLNIQMRSPGGRARPDGQAIRWRSAMIEGTMTPFFIEDDTPRSLRVDNDPEKTKQPNGVTGVTAISVGVFNMIEGIKLYKAILDSEPTQESFTTTTFTVGSITIDAIAPANADTTLARYLLERGSVPYMLNLRTNQPDSAGYLDLSRTHGALVQLTSM